MREALWSEKKLRDDLKTQPKICQSERLVLNSAPPLEREASEPQGRFFKGSASNQI